MIRNQIFVGFNSVAQIYWGQMPNELTSVTWSSKLSWVVVGSGGDAISTAIMAAYKAEYLIYVYVHIHTHQDTTRVRGGVCWLSLFGGGKGRGQRRETVGLRLSGRLTLKLNKQVLLTIPGLRWGWPIAQKCPKNESSNRSSPWMNPSPHWKDFYTTAFQVFQRTDLSQGSLWEGHSFRGVP